MAAATKDQFANYAIISCVESAANTLTFKKLETGISLTEKVAWVINRIEYFFNASRTTQWNASGDAVKYGLSVSNAFTDPSFTENTIIDLNQWMREDYGAAASGTNVFQPFIKDFANLPSGGIIVPPVPLYAFVKGVSQTAAESMVARINYTLMTLAVDQYWELVEARRVIQS